MPLQTLSKYAKWLWIIGCALFAFGEGIAAFDTEEGGTFSEWWRDAPAPLKYFIVFGMGAVLGHFVWPMPPKESHDINVNIENFEVNKDGEK